MTHNEFAGYAQFSIMQKTTSNGLQVERTFTTLLLRPSRKRATLTNSIVKIVPLSGHKKSSRYSMKAGLNAKKDMQNVAMT